MALQQILWFIFIDFKINFNQIRLYIISTHHIINIKIRMSLENLLEFKDAEAQIPNLAYDILSVAVMKLTSFKRLQNPE
jgi:hypothetical protein